MMSVSQAEQSLKYILVLQPHIARTMAPGARSPLRRCEEVFGFSSLLPSLLTLELGLLYESVSEKAREAPSHGRASIGFWSPHTAPCLSV